MCAHGAEQKTSDSIQDGIVFQESRMSETNRLEVVNLLMEGHQVPARLHRNPAILSVMDDQDVSASQAAFDPPLGSGRLGASLYQPRDPFF